MSRRQAIVVLTAVVLCVCYASTLRGIFKQWWTDEDMSHGFLVPLVILWVIWRERDRWRALPAEPSWWGFALLAAAACLQFAGALGVGLLVAAVSFVLSTAGVVLGLGGVKWLRVLVFPFVLALFMLP